MRHVVNFKPPTTPAELAAFIDHTLLKPDATEAAIETLCREALAHGFFAVCVNGAHVGTAAKLLKGAKSQRGTAVNVASVVGFPLGAMASSAKSFEAADAVRNGATEIDMVMRIDFAKEKKFSALREDVAAVVKAVEGEARVKVILETGLLTLEEIAQSARASSDAGAHFVKTCTGFSTSGGTPAGVATVDHVTLMRESIAPHVEVKASGGVRTYEAALAMLRAGATRLGTSSGVALVSGSQGGSGY